VTLPSVDTVVKVGGGLLADVSRFDAALDAIADATRHRALLVVPGGGRFADAVREADRQVGLSCDSAHWMAILAMDQFAHIVVERLAGGMPVSTIDEIATALDVGHIPALAPARWLREADPLPHSWDVTSDSIAAWVAGQVNARRLVLIKPAGSQRPGTSDAALVDPSFSRTLPDHVATDIVSADRIEALRAALAR
jgi:5-(aminomethyl)-3-furanmethanol phosphate kinase